MNTSTQANTSRQQTIQEYESKMFILFCLSTAVALIFLFVPLIQIDFFVTLNISWFDFIPGIGEFVSDESLVGDTINIALTCTVVFLLLSAQIVTLAMFDIPDIFNRFAKGFSKEHQFFYARITWKLILQICITIFGIFLMKSLLGDLTQGIDLFNIGEFFQVVKPWFLLSMVIQLILHMIAHLIHKKFKTTDAWKFETAQQIAYLHSSDNKATLPQNQIKRLEESERIMRERAAQGLIDNPYIIKMLEMGIANFANTYCQQDTFEEDPPQDSSQPNPQSNDQDTIALLKQYKQLLDDGILTEEEFQAKKEELLRKGK